MSAVPVSHVVTDGKGHLVRVDVCDCGCAELGDWEPSDDCPVHGRERA